MLSVTSFVERTIELFSTQTDVYFEFLLASFILYVIFKNVPFTPVRWYFFVNYLSRTRIQLETVTQDMLQHVQEEPEYRLYVCRVTGGAHIEHL